MQSQVCAHRYLPPEEQHTGLSAGLCLMPRDPDIQVGPGRVTLPIGTRQAQPGTSVRSMNRLPVL